MASRVGIAAAIRKAGLIITHDHLVGSLEEVAQLTDLDGNALSIDYQNFAMSYGVTGLWVQEELEVVPLADPVSLTDGRQVRIVAPTADGWTDLAGELVEAPGQLAVIFVRPLADVPLSRSTDPSAAAILTYDGALVGLTYMFSEKAPLPDMPAGLFVGYAVSAIAEFLNDVLEP